jgi:hypothetical protein
MTRPGGMDATTSLDAAFAEFRKYRPKSAASQFSILLASMALLLSFRSNTPDSKRFDCD